MQKHFILIAALLLIFSVSCKERKPKHTEPTEPKVMIQTPSFDSDSAFAFIKIQAEMGPRVPGSPAHVKCGEWLKNKLSSYIPQTIVQPFRATAWDNRVLEGKNIIASYKPEKNYRILLCAHWDSRPYADHDPNPANRNKPVPGVNDGASGVGVLLEIARQLSLSKPDIGVDIIFFDLEDYGEPQGTTTKKEDTWALGSQYWAKNPHISSYKAAFGILLDMVGAADAQFKFEGTSMHYAPDILDMVWKSAEKLGYGNYFQRISTNPITDDHYYINEFRGIPTIDIIHHDHTTGTGFFPHWHTIEDSLDKIDPNTLKAVGQTVLEVIFSNSVLGA